MTPPAAPDPRATLGQFNAWAAQGHTQAERDERLAQVPAQHRDQVASHLRVVVRLRHAD